MKRRSSRSACRRDGSIARQWSARRTLPPHAGRRADATGRAGRRAEGTAEHHREHRQCPASAGVAGAAAGRRRSPAGTELGRAATALARRAPHRRRLLPPPRRARQLRSVRLALAFLLLATPLAAQVDSLNRAFDLERRGNYAAAVTAYRAVLKTRPSEASALLGLERFALRPTQSHGRDGARYRRGARGESHGHGALWGRGAHVWRR